MVRQGTVRPLNLLPEDLPEGFVPGGIVVGLPPGVEVVQEFGVDGDLDPLHHGGGCLWPSRTL